MHRNETAFKMISHFKSIILHFNSTGGLDMSCACCSCCSGHISQSFAIFLYYIHEIYCYNWSNGCLWRLNIVSADYFTCIKFSSSIFIQSSYDMQKRFKGILHVSLKIFCLQSHQNYYISWVFFNFG